MKKIDCQKKYVINTAYKFRSDIQRVVLTNNNSMYCNNYDHTNTKFTPNFSTIMHPAVALLFSYFDGNHTLKEIAMNISEQLDVSSTEVIHTFSKYIDNEEQIYYPLSDDYTVPIPQHFIVENTSEISRKLLHNIDVDKMLNGEIDLSTRRFYIPNEVILMITNKCMTNCIYCYANTSHKVDNFLPLNRIKELIEEAYSIGCRDFGICGGDIFTYKHWDEVIKCLHEHEFNPYLSTKIPITNEIITQLKKLGIDQLQISLDSTNINTLKQMLNVTDDYFLRMRTTLDALKNNGIHLLVKSVITKYNDDLDDVKNLIDFLLQYENLYSLSIAPGEASLYKPYTYNSNKEHLAMIENYILSLNNPKVSMQSYLIPLDGLTSEEKMIRHRNRATCSGNVISFNITPDGQATICEQTYWHPFFNLGNVSEQSIMEVWNGDKAMKLWNIQQTSIRPESPCSTCKEFEECRRGAGSCWRMAIQAYGMDNYDYPYPQCPYAPPVTQPFYVDPTATTSFLENIR